MSNMTFTIDAVPTPKIDLAAAFEQDLGYYVANKRFPPLGRSALRQAEERLNNYLKYVNENFIQEGFSSDSATVTTAMDTKVMHWNNNGLFTLGQALVSTASIALAPTEAADLHFFWSITGLHTPEIVTETEGEGEEAVTTVTRNPGTLTVELWVDNAKMREWTQLLADGHNTMFAGACYGNRAAGSHVMALKMSLDKGDLAVSANDHYAWGQARIVR